MTRKFSLIFTVSLVITYFILLGLLGEEGFFHARSVKLEIKALRQRQEALILQVDSLEQQNRLMSSQDALKDAAFRFGYQAEGEQVFYFPDEEDSAHALLGQQALQPMQDSGFIGIGKRGIGLMALAFSLVFTVVWAIVAQRRTKFR